MTHDIRDEPPMVEQLKYWRQCYEKAIANKEGDVGAKLSANHKTREWVAREVARKRSAVEPGDAYEPTPRKDGT